jgi:hypothetical protein
MAIFTLLIALTPLCTSPFTLPRFIICLSKFFFGMYMPKSYFFIYMNINKSKILMISSCKVCWQEYRKIPCFFKNKIDIWFTTNWTNFSYWMISTSAISQHIISTLVGLSSFSKRNLSCLACYSLTLHTFGEQSICWTDKCK